MIHRSPSHNWPMLMLVGMLVVAIVGLAFVFSGGFGLVG